MLKISKIPKILDLSLPDSVRQGGIVRDPDVHAEICDEMSAWLGAQEGWKLLGIEESPITGAEGNKEFFLAGRLAI